MRTDHRLPLVFLASRLNVVLLSFLLGGSLLSQSPCETALEGLRQARFQGDFELAIQYLDAADSLCSGQNDVQKRIRLELERGVFHQARGGLQAALQAYFRALDLCAGQDVSRLKAEVLNNIGAVHQYQGNHEEAEDYYSGSLKLRKQLGELRSMGQTMNNFGALYSDMGRPEEALLKHTEALEIWTMLGDTGWIAIAYSNIGACLEIQGRLDSARSLYQDAMRLMISQSMDSRVARVEVMIAETYLTEGRTEKALPLCHSAWAVAKDQGAMQDMQSAAQCLYHCYKRMNRTKEALQFHELATMYRDSISGSELSKQVTKMELDYRFQQEQMEDSLAAAEARLAAEFQYEKELAEEEQKQHLYMFGGLLLLLLAVGLMSRLRYIRRSRSRLKKEKDRSDKLLLNILPASVAEELKTTGKAASRSFDQASILFSDFVDFTRVSKELGPEALVIELNVCFQAFDKIILHHGLEKIKTIGDAYMAAGGLHEEHRSAVAATVQAGLDMQQFIQNRARLRGAAGLPHFEMRLGIHTGAVVAGVVGDTKFQYDIWGDTVNIAARMESAGVLGEVNVSRDTRNLLEGDEDFLWVDRPLIEVKGLGMMKMSLAKAKHS